jgi:hypothetical protein
VNIKGTAVRARLEFIRGGSGAAGLEATLAALPPEDRRALEVALPTSWIPVELVDRLDVEIAREGGGIAVAREYGGFSARRNLSRVYRLCVDQAGGDPQALLQGLATLHSSFYDEGRMQAVDSEPGCCRVEIDFAGQASRFRCQVALGFTEEALRMLNVRALQVREESCQMRGAPRCGFAVRWRAEVARDAELAAISAPQPETATGFAIAG